MEFITLKMTEYGCLVVQKPTSKIVVWLEVGSKGVSPLVVFENGTVDHDRYIKEMLLVALKHG